MDQPCHTFALYSSLNGGTLAVHFYHHLIVTGSPKAVAGFADRIALVVTRRVAGVTSREVETSPSSRSTR